MALTLIEYAKLVENPLVRGVVEEFPRNSAVLQYLPFLNHNSDSYRYNREGTLPGVAFRGINESYVESVGVINPVIESLCVMGGVSDVDRALAKMQNINDIRSIHDGLKAKACARLFEKTFIKGNADTDPKSFDGLQARLTGSQVINAGASAGGDTLTLPLLDELLDAVQGGADLLLCNRTIRRKISALVRAAGSAMETVNDQFGKQMLAYAGVPIGIVDNDEIDTAILAFNEAAASGSSVTTSIYAVKFGALTGVSGIQCGPIDVLDLGLVSGQPIYRTLVEWLCTIAVFSGKSAARLRYIKNA